VGRAELLRMEPHRPLARGLGRRRQQTRVEAVPLVVAQSANQPKEIAVTAPKFQHRDGPNPYRSAMSRALVEEVA
jgi:hypothetical protein